MPVICARMQKARARCSETGGSGIMALLCCAPDRDSLHDRMEARGPSAKLSGYTRECLKQAAELSRRCFAALLLAISWQIPALSASGPQEAASCMSAPKPSECVFGRAIAVAATIPDLYERAVAFGRIAEGQALAGRTKDAEAAFSQAVLNAAAIGSGGDIDRPLTTKLTDDEIPYLRGEALTMVASLQSDAGQQDAARETLAKAVAEIDSITQKYWRDEMLILLSRVQAKAGEIKAARASVARATADASVSWLDGQLRETALAQARAGDFKGALVTAQTIVTEHFRGLAFSGIAGEQARAGDETGANFTANRIQGAHERMIAMHFMGSAWAEAGEINRAMNAAEKIREIQDESACCSREMEILYSDTLGMIAEAHAAAGSYGKALSLTAKMLDPLPIVSTHAAVAEAQISDGDLETARDTVETICENWFLSHGDYCVEALTGLVLAYAAAGDSETASAVMAESMRTADQLVYDSDRETAFAAIWKAQIRIGNADEIPRIFYTALAAAAAGGDKKERARDYTFLALTAMQAASHRKAVHKEAAHAFSLALEAAEQIEYPALKAETLAETAVGLARAEKLKRARQGIRD